jgi:hypothetical protein
MQVDIHAAAVQVEAWRARGRVPLGVDITASLLETTLCDPGFYRAETSTAAAAMLPGTAAAGSAAPGVSTGNSQGLVAVSHQQLRLQYAATIVRCVAQAAHTLVSCSQTHYLMTDLLDNATLAPAT